MSWHPTSFHYVSPGWRFNVCSSHEKSQWVSIGINFQLIVTGQQRWQGRERTDDNRKWGSIRNGYYWRTPRTSRLVSRWDASCQETTRGDRINVWLDVNSRLNFEYLSRLLASNLKGISDRFICIALWPECEVPWKHNNNVIRSGTIADALVSSQFDKSEIFISFSSL